MFLNWPLEIYRYVKDIIFNFIQIFSTAELWCGMNFLEFFKIKLSNDYLCYVTCSHETISFSCILELEKAPQQVATSLAGDAIDPSPTHYL